MDQRRAHRPYFVRYELLVQDGQGLAALYADRCARHASEMGVMQTEQVVVISQPLSMLLVYQRLEDIEFATRDT